MNLSKVKDNILAFMFPPECCSCKKPIDAGQYFCADCLKRLDEFRVKKAKYVSRNSIRYCIRSVYYYDGPAADAVKKLKFTKSTRISKFMGDVIAEKVSRMRNFEFDAVTFVPMTFAKMLEREYNQTQYIAERVAKRIGVKCSDLLRKMYETESQHVMSGSMRKQNLVGNFAVKRNVAGKTILLIDDVSTTGSTMIECAKTLLDAGAKSVVCYAFCQVK